MLLEFSALQTEASPPTAPYRGTATPYTGVARGSGPGAGGGSDARARDLSILPARSALLSLVSNSKRNPLLSDSDRRRFSL